MMHSILHRRRALMLLPAILFALLHAPALMQRAPIFSQDFLLNNLLVGFIAVGFTWPLFIILRSHRALFAVAVPLLFTVTALASYYAYHASPAFDVALIDYVLHSPPLAIREYMTLPLLLWMLLSLALSAAIVWLSLIYEAPDPADKKILLMAAAFLAGICITGMSAFFFPYNYIGALIDYAKTPAPSPTDISAEYTLTESAPKNLTALIVITDHTPQPRTGRTLRADAFACVPRTEDALPCMLGRASYLMPEEARNETTLLSIFRRHGFATAWFDMSGAAPNFARREAEEIKLFNTSFFTQYETDMAVVPALDVFLKSHPGRVMAVIRLSDLEESLSALDGIIAAAQSRPALIIFASASTAHAPLTAWTSDTYPKTIESHGTAISDDFIFHTLLDCSAFTGSGINKSLSLCTNIAP